MVSPLSPNAIIRGVQLSFVGAYRALQNPTLLKSSYIKQAGIALFLGFLLSFVLYLPIIFLRAFLYAFTSRGEHSKAVATYFVRFIENQVLQLPMVIMGAMQHTTNVADELFLESVRWADEVYAEKHRNESPENKRKPYYPPLASWSAYRPPPSSKQKKPRGDRLQLFLKRTARRLSTTLALYLASYIPRIGPLLPPAYTIYLMYPSVGPTAFLLLPTLALPRHYTTMILSTYLSSRAFTRDLLEPYFRRLPFTGDQKRKWFKDREAVLFGYGLAWLMLMKNAGYFKVLIYAAGTAGMGFAVTKLGGTPPPPEVGEEEVNTWCESECKWRQKKEFFKPVRFLKDFEEVVGSQINELNRKAEDKGASVKKEL